MRSSSGGEKLDTPSSRKVSSNSPSTEQPSSEPQIGTLSKQELLLRELDAELCLPPEVLPALPDSMTYAPVTVESESASPPIELTSLESLASFALSRSPGKLSRADLEAMRLLIVAQASKAGKLKEVNDALTGLEKLVEPKQAVKTVTNNTVILGALDRVRRRQGLVEE